MDEQCNSLAGMKYGTHYRKHHHFFYLTSIGSFPYYQIFLDTKQKASIKSGSGLKLNEIVKGIIMPAKMINILTVFLCVIFLFSACTGTKYSAVGVKGVRQVDQYDGDRHLKTYYQKFDIGTLRWYEAEMDRSGNWRFTEEGERDISEAKLSIGNAEGGDSG